MNMCGRIHIAPVSSPAQRREFFAFPRQIYAGDPVWIEPLLAERKAQWAPRHPFFAHAQAQAFIARRADRPVGVISAQIDQLQPPEQGRKLGYFGQFECIDDSAVALALVGAAEDWLRERACSWMRGPYDLGINQSCGLLVEGRETPPMIMMGHAPAYYEDLVRACGLAPEMDLLAYLLPPDFEAPAAMRRLLRRAQGRVRFRPLEAARFDGEIEILRGLFNDAWADNWGFVPLTEAEFRHTGREMKKILKLRHTCIAELDGQPAGFIVALPNINDLIADLHGRLLPIGWARLLWRLVRGQARSARVPLMGVGREFQRGPLGAAISFGMIDRVRQALHADGVSEVELSWILETNQGMKSMIAAMGGRMYKRYRMFGKSLD